jgi:signal transduction histidine kinase
VFNSLRFRLIASFVLIVVITLAAAGAGLYARLGGYRDQLTVGTLRQVAAPVYYNVAFSAARPGGAGAARQFRSDLLDYLRAQSRDTGVVVMLLDKDGNVMREGISDDRYIGEHFDVPPPADRGPNFSQLPDGKHKSIDGTNLVYVIVPMPVAVRQQVTGVSAIVVALPESAGADVYKDIRQRLFFGGIVGIVAAVVVALILWASLFRPLGKVTGGIRAVARGDYRQRVPVSGTNEVRALATDVNRMADSVEASQRELRDFLANVSHELKTPLTSIRGFSQAMLDGTLDTPEERAKAARVIDAESARLLHLVGELLDLSRIESGQQVMAMSDVRASELLTHIRDVFDARAGESGVALEIDVADDPLVAADFDRIEQVLGNLVDNAFRHAPTGSRVHAGVRPAGGAFAELYVRDEGSGIAPADLPHVFERFYRSQDEASGSGTGLGLAIAREIVRAHGGELRVESTSGGGATFSFTLPLSGPGVPRVRDAGAGATWPRPTPEPQAGS